MDGGTVVSLLIIFFALQVRGLLLSSSLVTSFPSYHITFSSVVGSGRIVADSDCFHRRGFSSPRAGSMSTGGGTLCLRTRRITTGCRSVRRPSGADTSALGFWLCIRLVSRVSCSRVEGIKLCDLCRSVSSLTLYLPSSFVVYGWFVSSMFERASEIFFTFPFRVLSPLAGLASTRWRAGWLQVSSLRFACHTFVFCLIFRVPHFFFYIFTSSFCLLCFAIRIHPLPLPFHPHLIAHGSLPITHSSSPVLVQFHAMIYIHTYPSHSRPRTFAPSDDFVCLLSRRAYGFDSPTTDDSPRLGSRA